MVSTASHKCKILTLAERFQVIHAHENEKLNVKELQSRFQCGKKQLYDILKRREDAVEDIMSTNNSVKRKTKSNNDEVSELLFAWFLDAQSRNLPVNGPIIKQQAKEIAENLNLLDFKVSNGWLDCFKKRHNISTIQQQYDGTGSMDEEVYSINVVKTGAFPEMDMGYLCRGSTSSYQPEYDYIESGYYERDIRSYREALDHIKAIQDFAVRVNNNELYNGTCELRLIAEKKVLKQTSLLDYWTPLQHK